MSLLDHRLLLIGGKGGVGKTSVSAALALLASEHKNTLLVSTDPAHNLSDLFETQIGDDITRVAQQLDALEIDPDHQARQHIEQVKAQMKRFAMPDMYPEIERQLELSMQSPGVQEAALLERICQLIEFAESHYDLIIFDTAPTGHTLRLLTLPEAMAAWTQGMLRSQDRSEELQGVLKHLSPKAGKDVANPMSDPQQHATDGMTDRTKAITEKLLERQRLFQRSRRKIIDPDYSQMLFILLAEKLPILETERAIAQLRKEKLPVFATIVNRLLPQDSNNEFLTQRREQQQVYLQEAEQRLAAQPQYRLPWLAQDIVGMAALKQLADTLAATGVIQQQ